MTTIVLAAGLSSRMGENKLLLPFRGKPILLWTVEKALKASGRVIAVTGFQREKIEEVLSPLAIETVYNPDYERGQRTSTVRGVEMVSDDDFSILPGDLPLLTEGDLLSVFSALKSFSTARGVHKGIPGHPVAYKKENRERLLAFSGSMKDYLKTTSCSLVEASIGSIFDIDTKERYLSLLESDRNPSVLDIY